MLSATPGESTAVAIFSVGAAALEATLTSNERPWPSTPRTPSWASSREALHLLVLQLPLHLCLVLFPAFPLLVPLRDPVEGVFVVSSLLL